MGGCKKVQDTTSSKVPVLKAQYYIGNYHFPTAVKVANILQNNNLSIYSTNNILSIELPNADPFHISLISLSGKVISTINGTGKKLIF
jgi:hypothetical protein